jgi:predicted MFS family arabinose efflux permease
MPVHASSRDWLAIVSIALGTFALVTSEILPVGLLPRIAADLRASDGAIGLMVTTPGIVAALAAPGVMLGARRLDRRTILWVMSGLLVISNAIVALAPNLTILLLGRVLLGFDSGVFWAISFIVAVKIVPQKSLARANSIIFAGVSVGSVVGVPAGALIGATFGWRASFADMAAFGAVALAMQFAYLTRLPPDEIVTLHHLASLFRNPKARLGVIATFLSFTGHLGGYTYMGAFLVQVTHTAPTVLSSLLLSYGIAGLVGNFVGGAAAEKNVRRTLVGTTALLGLAIVLLPVFGAATMPAAVFVILWGFTFGALPLVLQSWMLKGAPKEMDVASATYIAVIQVAVASGALLGGITTDHAGLNATLVGAGCLELITAVIIGLLGQAGADQPMGSTAP